VKTGAQIAVPEKDLQGRIIDYAHVCGWKVAHFRPARTEKGWRTAVSADGAGFPDLLMTRKGRMFVAELKSQKAELTDNQLMWQSEMQEVQGYARRFPLGGQTTTSDMVEPVRYFVWRPSDWDSGMIEEVLR